ncbi:hypothetical protein [Novosphingobium sp.]|uniref:hypothetical protein n=1 Tax=Novosphingobium sp. TaxID=1874826 RepID=UPI003340A555
MATTAMTMRDAESRERRFFLGMAVWIAVSVVAGFGAAFAMGHSSLASPWWVHLHALTFMTWTGLYVLQNAAVAGGQASLHRRLGWLAFGWANWMVVIGIFATCESLMAHRAPPFFAPAYFLALDPITVLTFYAFTVSAIVLRQRTDWHRRLMLSGTIFLISPAWGRMLPMPLLGGELGMWAILTIQLLLYFVVAAGFDLATRRRVHPAYFWGVGGSIVATALMKPVSMIPAIAALAHTLTGA